MREVSLNQKTNINERPFGRFLLSQGSETDRERLWHRSAYAYARNFAQDYGDQLHPSRSNFITCAEIGESGNITIPSGVPAYDKAVWLEFDKNQAESDTFTWRVNNAGEEFDMDISQGACVVTRYELNAQGSVLRRRTVSDLYVLEGLQALIESMVLEANIDEKIPQYRIDCENKRLAYEEIESQTGLSWRQLKDKAALKKRISETYFHVGSIGHRDKKPLY